MNCGLAPEVRLDTDPTPAESGLSLRGSVGHNKISPEKCPSISYSSASLCFTLLLGSLAAWRGFCSGDSYVVSTLTCQRSTQLASFVRASWISSVRLAGFSAAATEKCSGRILCEAPSHEGRRPARRGSLRRLAPKASHFLAYLAAPTAFQRHLLRSRGRWPASDRILYMPARSREKL